MNKEALELLKSGTGQAVWDVLIERSKQIQKWGKQHYPNVHQLHDYEIRDESFYKEILEIRRKFGTLSWGDILLEEVAECFSACATSDIDNLREELVQVAAVCLAWIENLDEIDQTQK